MLPMESTAETSDHDRKDLLLGAGGQQMVIWSSSLHLSRKQLQGEAFCLSVGLEASFTRDIRMTKGGCRVSKNFCLGFIASGNRRWNLWVRRKETEAGGYRNYSQILLRVFSGIYFSLSMKTTTISKKSMKFGSELCDQSS